MLDSVTLDLRFIAPNWFDPFGCYIGLPLFCFLRVRSTVDTSLPTGTQLLEVVADLLIAQSQGRQPFLHCRDRFWLMHGLSLPTELLLSNYLTIMHASNRDRL